MFVLAAGVSHSSDDQPSSLPGEPGHQPPPTSKPLVRRAQFGSAELELYHTPVTYGDARSAARADGGTRARCSPGGTAVGVKRDCGAPDEVLQIVLFIVGERCHGGWKGLGQVHQDVEDDLVQ